MYSPTSPPRRLPAIARRWALRTAGALVALVAIVGVAAPAGAMSGGPGGADVRSAGAAGTDLKLSGVVTVAGPVLAGGLLLWAGQGRSRRQAVRRFRAQLHHDDPMGLVHALDGQQAAGDGLDQQPWEASGPNEAPG